MPRGPCGVRAVALLCGRLLYDAASRGAPERHGDGHGAHDSRRTRATWPQFRELAAGHAPSQTSVQTYGRRGCTFELVVYTAEGIGRFSGPCATRAHGLVRPDDVPGLGDVGGGGHEEDPAVAADPHRRERRLRLRARLDGNQGSVIHGGEVARTTRRRVTPLGDAPFARSLEPSQRPDAGGPASSDHVTSGSCRRDTDRAVEPFIPRRL